MNSGYWGEVPFKDIVENIDVGIMYVDLNGQISYCNKAEAALRGTDAESLAGKSIFGCHSPESRKKVESILAGLTSGETGLEAWTHQSEQKYIDRRIVPVRDGQVIRGLIVVSIDVTKRESAKLNYQAKAAKDDLTGLYNRSRFNEVFTRYINRIGRDFSRFALLMLDINGLKVVNDTLGHEAGDQLIKAAAKVIRKSVRGTDQVFRIGGDEFVVLMPEADDQAANMVRDRIIAASSLTGEQSPNAEVSLALGWSIAESRAEAESAFGRADAAMYQDKFGRRKQQ